MTQMLKNHLNEVNELLFLPLQLWKTTPIRKWKESLMGIPQIETDTWREQYQVLDSDDIQAVRTEEEKDIYWWWWRSRGDKMLTEMGDIDYIDLFKTWIAHEEISRFYEIITLVVMRRA